MTCHMVLGKTAQALGKTAQWTLAAALVLGLGLSPARAEESISSKVLTVVSKLSSEQQEALYNMLIKLNADTPKAAAAPATPAPEKAIADSIKKVKEAAIKGDLDAVMALIADDFQQSQLGGRDALKVFLGGILASGDVARYAKDTEISSAKATVKNDNGKVTIDPIDVTGPWGSASLSFTAKLVGNEWKITSAELH